ncbi:nuclease [Cytobacillus oceanisediminis]|uniref:nuclease n=1 Tax=Cytobacillus oceanisediminis TaxID=665099 RepID=UPI001FB37F7D|nr:nuclease [Cytobacillus oceanisediminis]UOE58080.1 nuclease [Cytobacillus oceanisediminis]
MKEKILITSLSRLSKDSPWRVGVYLDDGYTFFHAGNNGKVATSPRFHLFLSEIEKKVSRYPVEIGFHHLTEFRDMEITKIREQIVYVDCGFEAKRLVRAGRYRYEKEVFSSPLSIGPKAEIQGETINEANSMFKSMAETESIPSTTMDYIAIAKVMKIHDGDTIRASIVSTTDLLSGYGINEGSEIEVRYNGIDAAEYDPEKKDEYKSSKNKRYADIYGLKTEDMFEVASEALAYNKKLLKYSENGTALVVLHFDRAKDGDQPSLDYYGNRYICDLYATAEKNPAPIKDKIKRGSSFVHVNKSMLVEQSKKFTHVPLANFEFDDALKGSSILNPYSWIHELNIKVFDSGDDNRQGMSHPDRTLEPNVEGDPVSLPDSELNTDTLLFANGEDEKPNNHNFFKAYDDRVKEFLKGIQTEDDLKLHSKVRIGDVILTIPPVAIDVDKTSNISRVKTLRTKSSVLVNRGQTLTTLKMDLYFHDIENINGKLIPRKAGDKENFLEVDGLRPLLAQFAKTPFVPIDNYYINEVIGVQDVGLMDIEVSTVPNFPESLTATLTLVEFNSEAYLMDHSSLNESISYPLMRWYYNQALVEREEKHRYFKRLEGPIKNELSFTLADEEFLEQRREAINWMKNADSPEKHRIDLKKSLQFQSKEQDSETAKKLLREYQVYKDANIKDYSVIDYFGKKDGFFWDVVKYLKDKYPIKSETAENAVIAGEEIFSEMYDNDFKEEWEKLTQQKNIFIPYESRVFYKERFEWNDLTDFFERSNETPPVDYNESPYINRQKQGIIILAKMKSVENQRTMESFFKRYFNEDKGVFYIPGTAANFEVLKKIASGADNMLETADKYEEEFNKRMRIIEASELGVKMNDFEIKGHLIPLSVNARFSNEFSSGHVLAGEAPTLQYLGGGDPYLDIVLEMDEDAAQDFSRLIRKSDEYAKQYAQGITNGYLGVKNDLAQLFGIRHIMFQSVRISTVPGFPGRFHVMISAIGFDKTQRQREELKALPGNAKHMDLEMLKAHKNAFANDRMIEARLRKLEVYPDLELPTYEEVNAILPHLDAGIKTYKNLTNGIYVDPDFYFSTLTTFRENVEKMYGESHQMNMFDAAGVAAYTSSGDINKLFNTTEADWGILEEMQKTDGVEPLNWVFNWSKEEEGEANPSQSAGQQMASEAAQANYKNPELKTFLTKTSDDGTPVFYSFPTKAEWQKLFPNYSYEEFKSEPTPSEDKIYNHLNTLVDKYFSKYYSAKNFIEDCKGDMKDADKSLKQVSYTPAEEFYSMVFDMHYSMGSTVSWRVDQLIKKEKIVKPKKQDFIKAKAFYKADKKPTKERFMTMMKAFLDKTTGWKHYKNNNPMVSKAGRAGIAQVDISSNGMSVSEAKKLIYNWKHNLEMAVAQLAAYYEMSRHLDDNLENFEVYCRPWDAMFALYENPNKKVKTSKDILASDVASGVISRFNHYAQKPFDTASGFNQAIYKKYAGLSKEEKITTGGGKKTDYVEALLELEYYDLKVLKKAGLKVNSDKNGIKKAMKEHLETLSKTQLYDLYLKHLKKLHDLFQHQGTYWEWLKHPLHIEDKNGYLYSYNMASKGYNLYFSAKEMDKAVESSQAASDTRLYNEADPQTLYREMFHDLRRHDQRGRMVRAFPGFQMFIIHEGDYFGKYKFWDNMYGFNAIESIDVHRSRKIAADTAVISMTNVYSNLTTRRTDIDFVDREVKWWDNYIWNEIPQDLIDKKANEHHKTISLETGARIHLRMGYSGNAKDLPVVFNGTITEMEIGDVIDIVAQGDGVELGNVISGDPDDDNDGLFSVTEPRDLICSLMGSKGSWIKDFMNGASDGQLFKKNPLGIMHFGQAWDTTDTTASKPLGNLIWYNDEYGEVAQNIYSSNGSPTFSQWVHPNGERNNIFNDFTWSNLWANKFKIFNPGDEKNVVVKFYNNTVWDIITTVANTSPDYIAAVHPFELRSTLFFGKPYWRCAFEYDSYYQFDESNKTWTRHLTKEARRPYMQHKLYTSHYDIIQNNIKASEDNLYTNVIVNYDGNQTPVLYADADIRYDKHKTRVVEANVVAKFADFYSSEVMATYFGMSSLRDNMKDMYKGNILVLGDPTVKPHDMMFLNDDINDINGTCQVKAVTHHFSAETGFVTSIEPDLLCVNDDQIILETAKWFNSFAASFVAGMATSYFARKGIKNLSSWLRKSPYLPKNVGEWVNTKGLRQALVLVNDGTSKDIQAALDTLDNIIKEKDPVKKKALNDRLKKHFQNAIQNLTKSQGKWGTGTAKTLSRKLVLTSGLKMLTNADDVAKASKNIIGMLRGVASATPIGFILNMGFWIGSEMLFEHYRRYKENLQCVVAMPLTYRGKELTAGINNHAGMVYGDTPGRYDKMFDATLFHDDGEAEFWGNAGIELLNFLSGSGGVYADQEKAKELNELGKGQ